MEGAPGSVEAAEDPSLVDDLEARRRRLVEHRQQVERSPPPHPPAADLLYRDLADELRHLDGLLRRLGAEPSEALSTSPRKRRRPPLPVRAVRVLWRRSLDAVQDLRWAAGRILASRESPLAGDTPLFSVVLPTRDRRERLLATLDAYGRQTSPLPFEILVVDDGSSDGTADAAEALRPDRYDLRVLRQDGRGPAAARNLALVHARGRWVLFTGDDVQPRPDLLLRHWQVHRRLEDPRAAVLGLTRWPPGPLTATMRHVDGPGAQQFNYAWLRSGRSYDFRHFYTSNLSLERSFLDRTNGFSTAFPDAAFEDAELAYRLSHHGLRIVYDAAPQGLHHHPYDARSFYRRQVRCGRMGRVLEDLHPELGRFTGRREVELRRAALAERTPFRSDGVDELDRLKELALTVADALDREDPPGTDDFLAALFHLAFFEGAAAPVGERESPWVVSLAADSLAAPARRLAPHLDGSAREAAERLAALPPVVGPVDPDFMHPVRKN